MRYYIGVVHKDEDSSFGVSFPDVPGVFSAAEDMAEVIPQAAEALALFSEDEALPAPRILDEVRRDPGVAESLAAGAFLVAVPFIENDARIVRINVSMESGMVKAIDQAANARKLTRSAFLAQAAKREIER
ncbi:MAG: type II toxin-antitoxin system HicB family antitoxin [Aestuariivirga sp.]|uniref:type II toxin-antitoxin system HicB family antitoxin n=1 Tax=Aestuariivirga sp. TaxID=2650926 RepID=UPI0025BAE77E|nr:type II toxin-antitoxin system HicB family antitoxin [Aestuariivirga sp.]MCA3560386.1 type II toxin-antitoxin system HicB family antitoxin [Aestuariivirga sp.]